MEPLKINLSVPFRVDGNDADHPGCLHSFTAIELRSYLDAIEKEIASASEGTEDLQVQEIVFGTGSFTHLGNDDPKRIVNAVKKHFSVHPQLKITLQATPSALNFFLLMAVKQLGDASILLEIPALDEAALQQAGFKCGLQGALDALDSCFNNGFRKFGVLVSPKYCATPAVMESTLLQVLARHPERICFDTLPEGELMAAVRRVLMTKAGYQTGQTEAAWYYGVPPIRRAYANQLGFGPGAVSVFDGQAVQTTSDFAFYCEHSEDFEALVSHG